MFRIEPLKQNFLLSKPERIVCKIPPLGFSFIELSEMEYFPEPERFIVQGWKHECEIIASGVYMYHDTIASTVSKKFFVVQITKPCFEGYYYLLRESKKDRYLVKVKRKATSV